MSTRVLAFTIRIALLLAVVCMLGPTVSAQTATFVSRGDTALLIAKMPTCTTACPDSILRTWSVYGQKYARIVPAKFTDTLRVLRTSQPVVATLQYLPFRASAKTSQVPALVIEWSTSQGVRLTSPSVPELDSIRAVAFMRYADGRTTRIPSPMTWSMTALPGRAIARTVGTMKDTLWLVAK